MSNGAELVMINKSFFLRHSNHAVQRHVRHTIQRFPHDQVLQQNLQTEVNWSLYKDGIVDDFMENGTYVV